MPSVSCSQLLKCANLNAFPPFYCIVNYISFVFVGWIKQAI